MRNIEPIYSLPLEQYQAGHGLRPGKYKARRFAAWAMSSLGTFLKSVIEGPRLISNFDIAGGRHPFCFGTSMIQMHSRPKEQREAIRNLVHLVLSRDMGTFTAERFKDWIKEMDARFRRVGLTLIFEIRSRTVHFTIKEIRTSRIAFKFSASSRVPFDDRDVVMSVEDFAKQPG
jgi:hypothetical protein